MDDYGEAPPGQAGGHEAEEQRHTYFVSADHDIDIATGADKPGQRHRPGISQPLMTHAPVAERHHVVDTYRSSSRWLQREDLRWGAREVPAASELSHDTQAPVLVQRPGDEEKPERQLTRERRLIWPLDAVGRLDRGSTYAMPP